MSDRHFLIVEADIALCKLSLATSCATNTRIPEVTDQKKIGSLLNSFELLTLVNDHTFVLKNPPGKNKRQTERKPNRRH